MLVDIAENSPGRERKSGHEEIEVLQQLYRQFLIEDGTVGKSAGTIGGIIDRIQNQV